MNLVICTTVYGALLKQQLGVTIEAGSECLEGERPKPLFKQVHCIHQCYSLF